jgi:hypothetical protein
MNALAELGVRFYRSDLIRFLTLAVPPGSRVLQVGLRDPIILEALQPSAAVGLVLTEELIPELELSAPAHRYLPLHQGLAAPLGTFDLILLADVLGKVDDVHELLLALRRFSSARTRIVVTNFSRLWQPALQLAERLGLKRRSVELNWLGPHDLVNLLRLSGYLLIRRSHRFLCPFPIPGLAALCNRFLVQLPIARHLALVNLIVARPAGTRHPNPSVSVIVPARDEKGNLEPLMGRLPPLGASTELIVVEGGSRDGTWEELTRLRSTSTGSVSMVALQQTGAGKADAVRLGLRHARGELVTILDADLTVPPEELPKLVEAVRSGAAELANGSRLVYPMEPGAMRFLNLLANHSFSLLFSWLLDQRVKDTLCGTKLWWREDLEWILNPPGRPSSGDPFGDFDLLLGAARLQLQIADVPVHYRARHYGETKILRWRHGLRLLRQALVALVQLKCV